MLQYTSPNREQFFSINYSLANKSVFTVWIEATPPKDRYFCLSFACFGSLDDGFRLRGDNSCNLGDGSTSSRVRDKMRIKELNSPETNRKSC